MAEKSINRSGKRMPCLYDKSENCCGCSACFSICPCEAIVMKEDKEGFLYPEVYENKCCRCYQCENVCPIKYVNKKGI